MKENDPYSKDNINTEPLMPKDEDDDDIETGKNNNNSKKQFNTKIISENTPIKNIKYEEPSLNNSNCTNIAKRFLYKLLNLDKKKRPNRKKFLDNIDLILDDNSNAPKSKSKLLLDKKKRILKEIISLDKVNESESTKTKKEGKIKEYFRLLFNINSDLMLIWKFTFSVFYMVITFMFFLKYIFLEIPKLKENEEPKLRIKYLYNIINTMFGLDLIFTLLIISLNGGSYGTFIKLPLKIYIVFPFPLKEKYIYHLIPKFIRIDLFKRVFNTAEIFILYNITHYVQNYYLKSFITYTNRMFAYLLKFGLYGHFTSCIFSYFDKRTYIISLYYTIETFTTIGFGDFTIEKRESLFIVIINLLIGINLFTVMTSNVKYLMVKISAFGRETSFKQQMEFLIFQMQSSTGKVFPNHLKKLMISSVLFRNGLSYSDIRDKYQDVLKVCRKKIIKDIQNTLLSYLKDGYQDFFQNFENDFINSLLEGLKPRTFKTKEIIVNYGQKVNHLYFLINGQLFAYNKYGKPVFSIFNSTLFCEYEFITGTRSDFMIKVHPNIPAYGFVINKKYWNSIIKKYPLSAKNFTQFSYNKRKKYLEWLDKSYSSSQDILDINTNEKNLNSINACVNSDVNISMNASKNIVPVKRKGEKYDLENLEIIKKINRFNKEINFLEESMIQYKQKMLNFLKH